MVTVIIVALATLGTAFVVARRNRNQRQADSAVNNTMPAASDGSAL